MGVRKDKIDTANILMRRSFEVMRLCGDLLIPYLFEFPEDLGDCRQLSPASAWQFPELKKIADDTYATRYAIYQDDYGAPYMKPTGFLSTLLVDNTFGVVGWPEVDEDGWYRGPLQWKKGKHMAMGPENAGPAAAYPLGLCA